MSGIAGQLNRDREVWLQRMAKKMEPWFAKYGKPLPPYRIGVGFTSTGRRSKRIAECWSEQNSADNHCEIFVHPGLADPIEVAAALLHELCHAAVGVNEKHSPEFRTLADFVGLVGPSAATRASEELVEDLRELIDEVGAYPHAKLDTATGTSTAKPKQRGRMFKAECPRCHYIIRASKACFDLGVPPCPNKGCPNSYHNAKKVIPMKAEIPDWAMPKGEHDATRGPRKVADFV